MPSTAQIAANRRNAQKSTGPCTADGRNRTRLNALQHGITRQVTLMTDDQRPAFMESCAELVADLAPIGVHEHRLAQAIAEDYWRLDRSRAAEHNLFALGNLAGEEADEATGKAIELVPNDPRAHTAITHARVILYEVSKLGILSLYEQRLHRSLHKNLAMLRELQTERKAEERGALEEALRLHARKVEAPQIAAIVVGGRFDPSRQPEPAESLVVNGFVFSNEDLERELDRRDRYWHRAKAHDPKMPRRGPAESLKTAA